MSLDQMPSEVPDKAKVVKFLTDKKAAMPNYIFNDTEAAVDAWVDRADFRATPAVIVYDQAGDRVKSFENAKTSEVEAAVEKLLAGK